MSGIASTLARASCQRGSRLTVAIATSPPQTCQRRSTSWIAWEQPNPSLYAPPPQPSQGDKTQQAAGKTQNTRSVGETVSAPATTAVARGSQEVSTSGKTVPLSIKAGTSGLPYSQSRSSHSQNKPDNNEGLPTTIIRIPGESATWPVETPEHPDQPRVRKTGPGPVHENEGPVRKEETPTPAPEPKKTGPKNTTERHILQIVSNLAFGLEALKQNPSLAHCTISFDKAIKKYMEGCQTRHEVIARAAELDAARRARDEQGRQEWRRFIREAVDSSRDEDESKGEGKREGE
ncbi:hypothetical protein F5Y05DRAFT_418287 [Hypoxylon sp. FL0543]|nr:hypothetical protein F5Y05DRAFT_418287 [Hypoxylon sp. FL0543]